MDRGVAKVASCVMNSRASNSLHGCGQVWLSETRRLFVVHSMNEDSSRGPKGHKLMAHVMFNFPPWIALFTKVEVCKKGDQLTRLSYTYVVPTLAVEALVSVADDYVTTEVAHNTVMDWLGHFRLWNHQRRLWYL